MSGWLDIGIEVQPSGKEEQRLPCPRCARSERDDTLGANVKIGTFHCFRCGFKGRVGNDLVAVQPIRINDPSMAQRKRERLRKTIRETVPLTAITARAPRQYLISRGLGEVLRDPPKVLRAHPGLEYWDGTRSLGRFPALVALVHGSSGQPVTLHATYLRSDGCKAAVPAPKKILGVPVRGATKGGAIRLFEARGSVLGVAEGIETALSLHLLRKIPVWAAFCAGNLERIRLPTGLRELQIAVDRDASGKGDAVAKALGKRVMRSSPRTRVLYIRPEIDGPGDLNDELRRLVYAAR